MDPKYFKKIINDLCTHEQIKVKGSKYQFETVVKVKPQIAVCEDCDQTVENRSIDIKIIGPGNLVKKCRNCRIILENKSI